jgi:hypothetical protein
MNFPSFISFGGRFLCEEYAFLDNAIKPCDPQIFQMSNVKMVIPLLA